MKLRLPTMILLLVFITCLVPDIAKAATDCDVRVSVADSAQLSPTRGFGLMSSASLVNPLRIELLSQQPGCFVLVGFASRSGNVGNRYMSNGFEQIRYQLLSRPNGSQELADLPTAQDDALLRGTVNAKHATAFQYYLVVPGNQAAQPGVYQDQVDISVYSETRGLPQLVATHTVEVAMTIRPEIDLQILAGRGSGSAPGIHALDFGELQSGEQLAVRIKVNSNVAFAVSVTSENGGVFRHVTRPQASIPYTLQLGTAKSADWRRPVSLTGHPATGSRISFLPMTIVVGSVEHSLAGLYRDRLLVTVQAQ